MVQEAQPDPAQIEEEPIQMYFREGGIAKAKVKEWRKQMKSNAAYAMLTKNKLMSLEGKYKMLNKDNKKPLAKPNNFNNNNNKFNNKTDNY